MAITREDYFQNLGQHYHRLCALEQEKQGLLEQKMRLGCAAEGHTPVADNKEACEGLAATITGLAGNIDNVRKQMDMLIEQGLPKQEESKSSHNPIFGKGYFPESETA
jgi:hypothetical protein